MNQIGKIGQSTDFVQSRNSQQVRQTNGFYLSESGNRRVDVVDRAPVSSVCQKVHHYSDGTLEDSAMYSGVQGNDVGLVVRAAGATGQANYGEFIDTTQEETAFYSQQVDPVIISDNRINNTGTAAMHTVQSNQAELHSSNSNDTRYFSQTNGGTMETSQSIGENSDSLSGRWPLTRYRLQQDQNPIVIRRATKDSAVAYQQNIHVRFLKPPALPTPGPLIIKEIRPPQIAPAPPLIIRQRPVMAPALPPVVLREMPPSAPAIPGTQVITKRLPALPPPPRQIIVERYAPAPPKPRDVIIERWLPYDRIAKRRVIHQRAAARELYKAKKNVIIHYDRPSVRYSRKFNKYGVYEVDPRSYVARYGGSLMDRWNVMDSAKRLGVYEDISSPPAITKSCAVRSHNEEMLSTDRNIADGYLSEGLGRNIEKNAFTHSYESLNIAKSDGTNSWAKVGNNSSLVDDVDEAYRRDMVCNMNSVQELYNDEVDGFCSSSVNGGYDAASYIDSLVSVHHRDGTRQSSKTHPTTAHNAYVRRNVCSKYGDILNGAVSNNYDSGFYAEGTDIERSLQTDWVYGASGNYDMNDIDSAQFVTAPSLESENIRVEENGAARHYNNYGHEYAEQYMVSNGRIYSEQERQNAVNGVSAVHEACEEAMFMEEIKLNDSNNTVKC